MQHTTLINITDKKNTAERNGYFNEKSSNVKCNAENSGNVNLCLGFFHCKLYVLYQFQKPYLTLNYMKCSLVFHRIWYGSLP